MLAGEMPVTELDRTELDSGIGLVDLLVRTRLAESKGAARKLVEGGGVYLSNERQTDTRKTVSAGDLKWPGAILLRAGKKNYHLVLTR
jgi:tyrosyl-tRNA synthetase